jgi:hypothetical protein
MQNAVPTTSELHEIFLANQDSLIKDYTALLINHFSQKLERCMDEEIRLLERL